MHDAQSPPPRLPRLRDLGPGFRLGLTALILTMLGGLFASLVYLHDHYANRDEDPRLTLRDIEGAYRGATIPAPILTAIQRGHPNDQPGADLPDGEREMLLAWLRAPAIAENYENFDLGPPADIIADRCATCHTRAAAADPASPIRHSLQFADEVLRLARTRDMQPTPTRVLIISTHAHATTLALVGAFAISLLALSFWPRWLVGALAMAIGLGLLIDVGSWWAIRVDPSWWIGRPGRLWVYGIVGGGALFNGGVWLALLMAMVELWRPRLGDRGRSADTPNRKGNP